MLMSRSASRVAAAVRHLRPLTEPDDTDGALLARFALDADEAAFSELVARHGPMVRGATRRLLNDTAAADDVFQATFLVLARKAGSTRWRTDVGPWLYAVAIRLARKLRSRRTAASVDPTALTAVPASTSDPVETLGWDEVKVALDEEVA